MSSSLGLTLGIVAGAIAIGVTAGFAAPLIAPAFFAGTTFAGGAALFGGAIALAGGQIAMTATAEQPDPSSGVSRRLSTTADAEAIWEWVYGDVIKGGHVAWAGVGGSRDQLAGVDYVLACHACDSLVAIEVDNWYLPITTAQTGVSTANGKGLILNGNRLTGVGGAADSFTEYPDDWYVPVNGSPWVRHDQTQNGDRDAQTESGDDHKAHIALKVYYGTQTATDTKMSGVFGSKYNSVARKFTGLTVAHIIFRGHTELGTLGQLPQVKFRLKGKNDLPLNDSGSSTGYSASAAAVLADYMITQVGVTASQIINHAGSGLASLITECADTTWHNDNSQARYEFHGVIRDDVEIVDACNLIASHMAGGYSERGASIVFWTGKIRSVWSDGPLTVDDFRGQVTITQPDEDNWVNKLVPHFVPRLVTDEDGNTHLHGAMEPAKPIGSSTYVTEDNGAVLQKDVKFEGCNTSRRASWMAQCALDALRLGAQYTRRFSKRALVLEVGDVVAVNDPEWLSGDTKFRVVRKSGPDPQDFTVELTLQRYEDAIYTQATVSEDALGVITGGRGTILETPQNLAVTVPDSEGRVGAGGKISFEIMVTWDAPSSGLVMSAGGVEIETTLFVNDWPGTSTTAGAGATSKVIAGFARAAYKLRARFLGIPTGGRSGRPVGDWTEDILFTPSGATDLPGPPGSLSLGATEIDDPNFEQGGGSWEFDLGTNGVGTIQTTGGRYGPYCAKLTMGAAHQTIYVHPKTLTPCEVGERRVFRFWRKSDSGTGTTRTRLNVRYFGAGGISDFISKVNLAAQSHTGTTAYERIEGVHTVPDDDNIRFMSIEGGLEYVDAVRSIFIDGFRSQRVFGGVSTVVPDISGLNTDGGTGGQNWQYIRSIWAASPGDPVYVKSEFGARWGHDGGATADVSFSVEILRYADDGVSDETTILAETTLGDPYDYTLGNGYTAWAHYSIDAIDATGGRGSFVYRVFFRTNRQHGKAQVRYRMIFWELVQESAGT